MIYNVKFSNGDRSDLINYILKKKLEGPFRVVDIGGSVGGWSSPYVDVIVDFNDLQQYNPNIKHFKCDITHPDSYVDILNYVEEHGKFDFCICSHTLEDIMNPLYVCEQMCKIANAGYIAFPSKYREFARMEGYYRGFIHHRWIFNVKNGNKIIAFPKVNFIEHPTFDSIANPAEHLQDLSFYWENSIEMECVNNNYLGPSINSVINYYNDLFTD